MKEQANYARAPLAPNCKRWFLEARYNDHAYGGVFAFLSLGSSPNSIASAVAFNPSVSAHDGGTFLFVQGICRYLASTVAPFIDPDLHLRSLNSLLQPELVNLARELGASQIYVTPIGKQTEILYRYGYARLSRDIASGKTKGERNYISTFQKPCPEIADNAGLGPGLLYKTIV